MTNIIAYTEDIAEMAVGQVGGWVSVITSNPLILLFVVALPLCGIGVGFLKRLMRA